MKAYIYGLFYGDGNAYIHKNGSRYVVRIGSNSEEIIKLVQKYFSERFGIVKKIKIRRTNIGTKHYVFRVSSNKPTMFDLFVRNISIAKKLIRIDFFMFFSGLMDAEGSLSDGKYRISMSDAVVMKHIADKLKVLGIRHSFFKYIPSSSFRNTVMYRISFGKQATSFIKNKLSLQRSTLLQ